MIQIRKWQGRLGNNIIQVKHALQIAHFYSNRYTRVCFPPHPFFTTTEVVTNPHRVREEVNVNILWDEYNFYYAHRIRGMDPTVFTTHHTVTLQTLKSIFLISKVPSLGFDTAVLHIRSGDIFQSRRPHAGYIMPPLSYYTTILDRQPFRHVELIAEDMMNPVISPLLDKYPHIHFQKRSLEEDIVILLGAHHVISSYGTFVPALLVLSDHIRTLYNPSYQMDMILSKPSVSVFSYPLGHYYRLQKPWVNSPEQRRRMLEYR